MFKRKIYSKLVEWKNESDGRTALLVEGARRIGKGSRCHLSSSVYVTFPVIKENVLQINDMLFVPTPMPTDTVVPGMNKPVSWQASRSIPPTPLPTPAAMKLYRQLVV